MSMRTAITAARIFDGEGWHENAALLLDGDRCAGIVAAWTSVGVVSPCSARVASSDGRSENSAKEDKGPHRRSLRGGLAFKSRSRTRPA